MTRPATLETLRESFERAHHPSAAWRARRLAALLRVPIPDWARLGRPRRDTLDLEGLRLRHDRGGLPPDRLARLRMLARRRAEAAGLEVPAWAIMGPKGIPRAERRTGHRAGRSPLDLDALRERHDRAGMPVDRRVRYRLQARRLALVLGVDVPEWARRTGHRAGRSPLDLDALRERHDRAGMPVGRRGQYRLQARRLALALGVDVPEWARRTKSPDRAYVDDSLDASELTLATARSIATLLDAPSDLGRTFGRRPKAHAANAPNAISREIPAPLRAWREAYPCRVVQMTGKRVTLHERGAPSRSFASVADAIAAVASARCDASAE